MKKAGQKLAESTLIRAFVKPPYSHIAAGIGLFACLTLNAFAFDRNDIAVGAEVVTGKQEDNTLDDAEAVYSFYGSLTLPVFSRFNLHLESTIQNANDELTGIGLHAYWQHPRYGLLGLTTSAITAEIKPVDGFTEQINVTGKTAGLEAEAYMGPVTLALQGGRVDSSLEYLDGEDYSAADIYLSATPNLYLHGGTRKLSDTTLNRFETGYTFASAFTFYAGGMWDDFEYQYVGIEYLHAVDSKSNLAFTLEVDKGEDGFQAIYLLASFGFGPIEKAPLIPLFDPVSGGFR